MTESALALHRLGAVSAGSPELRSLVERASPAQIDALAAALSDAYRQGERDAESRAGRFVASVIAPILGVPVAEPNESAGGLARRLARLVVPGGARR